MGSAVAGPGVCASCALSPLPALALSLSGDSQSAAEAPRPLAWQQRRDGAREREDGRCTASAPERSGGVVRSGRPLGGANNNAEGLRVVEIAQRYDLDRR